MSYDLYDVDIYKEIKKVLNSLDTVDMRRDDLVIIGYNLLGKEDLAKALEKYNAMNNEKVADFRKLRYAQFYFDKFKCCLSGFKALNLNDLSIMDVSIDEFCKLDKLDGRGIKKLDDGSYELDRVLPIYYKDKYLGHVDWSYDYVCVKSSLLNYYIDCETLEFGIKIDRVDILCNIGKKLNHSNGTYKTGLMNENELRVLDIHGHKIQKSFKVARDPMEWDLKILKMLRLPNSNDYMLFEKSAIINVCAILGESILMPNSVNEVYFCDKDLGFKRTGGTIDDCTEIVLPPSITYIGYDGDMLKGIDLKDCVKLMISENSSSELISNICWLCDIYEKRKLDDMSRDARIKLIKNKYSDIIEFY